MKWINIKDQLPQTNTFILFTDGNYIYQGYIYMDDFGTINWFDLYAYNVVNNVNHWHPMIELPENKQCYHIERNNLMAKNEVSVPDSIKEALKELARKLAGKN